MRQPAIDSAVLLDLERMVVASVAITARALAEVAPELTFVQWRVLVLVDPPEGVGVGSIALALGAKIAAMSRLIGRLRAHGLVETRRAADDARVVLVSLTDRGRDLRARVTERRRSELRAAIAPGQVRPGTSRVIARLATVLEGLA